MPDPAYVAIEGPIGVGKTTLARKLQAALGAELLLEIFEENPFLSGFYADRERFAFQTQIFFLLSRYRQQREAQRNAFGRALLSDYILAKDRLFAHLNLHGDELEMYERVHGALAERVRVPDLVVYLRADPDVLLERIATRDRPYERGIARSYIVALAAAYDRFFASYRDTRLLTIDTDGLNPVGNLADLERIGAQVREALLTSDPSRGCTEPQGPGSPASGPARDEAGAQPNVELPALTGILQECLALQEATGRLSAALRRALAAEPLAPGAVSQTVAACESAVRRLAQQWAHASRDGTHEDDYQPRSIAR